MSSDRTPVDGFEQDRSEETPVESQLDRSVVDGEPAVDTPAPRIDSLPQQAPLTGRERRRRIALLVLLLLLLAVAGFLTFWWLNNRSMPVPGVIRGTDAIAPPTYLYSITGSGKNALTTPIGVDVAANGNVYVVDFGKRRISVFTSRGTFIRSFNEIDGGTLRNPVRLQILRDEVWVTDRRLRGIYVFGLDGKFKRRFEPVNEEGFDWTPLAFGFDRTGALRATDVGQTTKHRLLYFTEEGSRTATIGRTAQVTGVQERPGDFYFPSGLAVASDGRVFVSDGDNRRVQVFDSKAKFKKVIDTSGVPRGLAIDSKQRLMSVDVLAHTVDVWDLEGKRLTSFGERGFGPGQFNYPSDIAIDSRDRIYISDRVNNQVQVWGWPALQVRANLAPTASWNWAWCLLPLLLLPLLFLLRRRRYVITPAFLAALVDEGRADLLKKRVRYVAPETDRSVYEGRTVEDIRLEDVIRFEEHSASDVAALRDKLRCDETDAIYLTLADRSRALLTSDIELRRLGIIAKIRVYDVDEYIDEVSGGKS